MCKYSFNRQIDFCRKVVPQPFLTFFIELNGFDKFGLGLRMKTVFHEENFSHVL